MGRPKGHLEEEVEENTWAVINGDLIGRSGLLSGATVLRAARDRRRKQPQSLNCKKHASSLQLRVELLLPASAPAPAPLCFCPAAADMVCLSLAHSDALYIRTGHVPLSYAHYQCRTVSATRQFPDHSCASSRPLLKLPRPRRVARSIGPPSLTTRDILPHPSWLPTRRLAAMRATRTTTIAMTTPTFSPPTKRMRACVSHALDYTSILAWPSARAPEATSLTARASNAACPRPAQY